MHLAAIAVSVFVACVLLVKGQPQQQFQQQQQQQFQQPQHQQQGPQHSGGAVDALPAGVETIIGQLQPGFTCDNKVYGYYADVANQCKVFHVCWPIVSEHGATLNKQWTFVCGNQTLFNQERLVCDRPENVDCSQAESFYSVNNEFGKLQGQQ